MKCYICEVNEAGPYILVRELEAMDDSVMYHDDYHSIRLCRACNDKIERRIKAEEEESRRIHTAWVAAHPREAYTMAQTTLDAICSVNGRDAEGLTVRDILPGVEKED